MKPPSRSQRCKAPSHCWCSGPSSTATTRRRSPRPLAGAGGVNEVPEHSAHPTATLATRPARTEVSASKMCRKLRAVGAFRDPLGHRHLDEVRTSQVNRQAGRRPAPAPSLTARLSGTDRYRTARPGELRPRGRRPRGVIAPCQERPSHVTQVTLTPGPAERHLWCLSTRVDNMRRQHASTRTTTGHQRWCTAGDGG
jgi:hypothetical protein